MASSTAGAAIVGISASSANTMSIQFNKIGNIRSSGVTATTAAGFVGIDAGSAAGNITHSDNLIGNTLDSNIKVGYMISGTNLGTLANLSVTASGTSVIVGIRSSNTGNTYTATNNTIRGIVTNGSATTFTGITCGGTMTGTNPTVTVQVMLWELLV